MTGYDIGGNEASDTAIRDGHFIPAL